MQRVMQSNNGSRHHVWHEVIEVLLGSFIRVVTIDPEKSDRHIPLARNLVRKLPAHIDEVCNSSVFKVGDELVERRRVLSCSMSMQLRVIKVVGVDRYDGRQAELVCKPGEHYCGFSLEAPNLDDRSVRRGTNRGLSKKTSLVLQKKSGNVFGSVPCLAENRFEVFRRMHIFQNYHLALFCADCGTDVGDEVNRRIFTLLGHSLPVNFPIF